MKRRDRPVVDSEATEQEQTASPANEARLDTTLYSEEERFLQSHVRWAVRDGSPELTTAPLAASIIVPMILTGPAGLKNRRAWWIF